MFFLMNGWDMFMNNDLTGTTSNTPHQTLHKIVLTVSILAAGFWMGHDPDRLAKLAFYTTPAALAITAAFALFPRPAASALYVCMPVFFAPALMSRIYGVIRTSEESALKCTRYVSCVIFCLIAYTAWVYLKPPKEAAYLVPALLALPAWIGIRRAMPGIEKETPDKITRFSKQFLLLLAASIAVLFWLNLMNLTLRSYIIDQGYANSANILVVLGLVLPPIGFIIYAYIGDKGYERGGIIGATGLVLVSVILALLPNRTLDAAILPLAVVNGLGGSYTQYFSLTILPLYFYKRAKRPVLVTSLGVVFLAVNSVLEWQSGFFMPGMFRQIGAPLLASIGISAVVFLLLVYTIFERRREMTLAAALYSALHHERTGGGAEEPPEKISDLFTQDEIAVALLMIDGKMRSEITRSLNLSAAEADSRLNSIRNKIRLMGDPDPVIAAAVAEYSLTRRETDMLRCLRRGMSNAEIAAELFLSEDTVKSHVRNLFKKLGISTRKDIKLWEETLTIES